ncbi:hypothetical protein FNV43_RR27347 [Rhamnella rubrinervis]|uniref:Uncharacterized protein n=1 Tax=Rhamnella rubrinervis TaxID=2594499 RepID=A0A8K0DWR0_9ROSA|nr:hypothetical protein FNV43_RR27347 [Rhamnella rubrinervis]
MPHGRPRQSFQVLWTTPSTVQAKRLGGNGFVRDFPLLGIFSSKVLCSASMPPLLWWTDTLFDFFTLDGLPWALIDDDPRDPGCIEKAFHWANVCILSLITLNRRKASRLSPGNGFSSNGSSPPNTVPRTSGDESPLNLTLLAQRFPFPKLENEQDDLSWLTKRAPVPDEQVVLFYSEMEVEGTGMVPGSGAFTRAEGDDVVIVDASVSIPLDSP